MEKLTIRKLEKKDAAAICKINAEGLGGTDDLALVQEKIDKIDPAREAAFVAEADGQVLGIIHIERYDLLYSETMANVLGLSVKKEFHKQGIGKALLFAAEDWAREMGIKKMRLNSGAERVNAHNFYRHLGYVEEKDQKRFIKKV